MGLGEGDWKVEGDWEVEVQQGGTGTGWDIEDGCVCSDRSIRESLIMVDVENE